MFNLTNPENRRGLRNVLQGVALMVLLWFVYDIIQKLSTDVIGLWTIATDTLMIIALSVFLDKAENITRAITFKTGADGMEAKIGEADAPKE